MSQFSNDELRIELNRELARRKRLYPNLVRMGVMSRKTADLRIDAMKEIVRQFAGTSVGRVS